MERPFLEGANDSTRGFPEKKILLSRVFPLSSIWPASTTTDIRVNRLVRMGGGGATAVRERGIVNSEPCL